MSPRRVMVGVTGLAAIATLFTQVICAPAHAKFPRQFYNVSSSPVLPLKFRDDGSFQLSIFEDLHFGENSWDQWGPQQDINSVKVLNKILDKETPDLAVLNGDLITGNNAFLENGTIYVDQIAGPLVQRGLTWASTYGNHDSDFNLSRYDLLAKERQWPNARTRSMVEGRNAGVSNYYLPVYGKDCDVSGGDAAAAASCVPVLVLWFFDSRGGFYFQELDASGKQVGQPDWVDATVVDWFEATHAALTAKYAARSNRSSSASYTLPSLAFVHIPTNVSYAIQQDRGIENSTEPGVNDDNPLAQQGQGWCADGSTNGCDYGGNDEPFMRAIANAGAGKSIIAMFSGHDHGDTWCYKWDKQLPGMSMAGTGVGICFGQHSGYGGYGSWTRGARQVRVTEDAVMRATGSRRCQPKRPDIDTWIRLETGDIVGKVTLNATYGTDVYPPTPDTFTSCPTCIY